MIKWIVLLCGVLVACSSKQTKTVEEVNYYQIDFSALMEQGKPQEVKLDEWGKNIRFIPLDVKGSAPSQFYNKLILNEEKLLITHSDGISRFDLNGKRICEIGRKGGEPEEYSRLFGLHLKNDTIIVRDGNYNLKLYDWQGKFLCEKFTPELRGMLDLYPLPASDVFLGYLENRSGKADSRLIFFQDTTILKTISGRAQFEIATDNMIWGFFPTMKPFDGTVPAFKELFNDTIYQVGSNYTIHPYAVVHLGKYGVDEGYSYSLTEDVVFKDGFDIFNGKLALVAIGEKEDIIYFAHHRNRYEKLNQYSSCSFSYDKKSDQSYYQKIIYPDNQYEFTDNSTFVPYFISKDGKYLIDIEQTKDENNLIIVLVER